MEQEELFKQYYIEFGYFPTIMMTTNGESDDYLKAIDNAIKSGKPLTQEDLDKIFDEPYDVEEPNEEEIKQQYNEYKKQETNQASKLFDVDLTEKEND